MRRGIDDEGLALTSAIRTDYRCAANGCPNAGCIDDAGDGERRGTCYHHWRQPDRRLWDAITQRVRADFDSMRNHGERSPELWARQRAEAHERAAKWEQGQT